jgi:hypothetical protein
MEAKSPYKALSLDMDLTDGADYTLVVTGHLSDVELLVVTHHQHTPATPIPYPGFTSTADIIVFAFRAVGKMRVQLSAPQDYEASPWHISCNQNTLPTF